LLKIYVENGVGVAVGDAVGTAWKGTAVIACVLHRLLMLRVSLLVSHGDVLKGRSFKLRDDEG
jgi:hypothetical protein